MARSDPFGKEDIRDYLKSNYDINSTILDVGAGEGTYYRLLNYWFPYMDAVEVFERNITDYELEKKYHNVYNVNIKDFEYNYYDIVIFGDVIEHLEVEEAQKVLEYALEHSKQVIVAVPYQYKQGEVDGNIYEIHKQDDLTEEAMEERYPYLKLLFGNEGYGYYIKKEN